MQGLEDIVCWYAMRAYKNEMRAEEVVRTIPALECFVAKRYELRTYHGKKVRKLVPLIPSLIFVRGTKNDIQHLKQRYQFFQYIGSALAGERFRPLTVPDKQMSDFMKIAGEYESDVQFLSPAEVALAKGTRVKVIGGAFDGIEGVVLYDKIKNSTKVVVSLPESLGSISTAEISPELLQIVDVAEN